MKNPFLAFVLSLVIPGAGLAYLGQWLVGLVNLLVVIALWFSLTLSFGDVVDRYVYSHYLIFAFFSAWVAMNLSVLKKMKDSIVVNQGESAAVSSTASVDVLSEPFIGQIQMFAFGYAPVNWAPCDRQVLQIKEHMALFSLLGNKYGGDGINTFALPNLTAFEANAGIKHFIAINGVFPTRS